MILKMWWKKKSLPKKIISIVAIVILCYLLYLIIGATAPFGHYPEVTKQEKQNFFSLSDFGEEISCDRAMILEENQDALVERLRLMSLAKKQIVLTTFDMREGQSTKELAAMLIHKADEGVKVKILVDGISTVIRMERKPLFYALAAHENIEIKSYNPLNLLKPWMTQGRMHEKYLIVDDIAYVAGGRNTFNYFLGEYNTKNKSLDREVLVYNTQAGQEVSNQSQSSIYELQDYFEKVWNLKVCKQFHEEKDLAKKSSVQNMYEELEADYRKLPETYPGLYDDIDYEKCTVETQGVKLILGESSIYEKRPLVFEQQVQLMSEAKESVLIHTPYIVCNDQMYERLKTVTDKVPHVSMVINSVENGDNFFASADYLYNKKEVIDLGTQLYEYNGGHSTHGKSIVIDGEVSIVGSYNMDLRSTYMDSEMMVAVKSKELAQILTGYMEQLNQDCTKVVTVDTYEIPEHVVIEKVPAWKKAAMRVVGFIMQAFRYEV